MDLLKGYRFWEWFLNNQVKYDRIDQLEEDEASALCDTINKVLRTYFPNLYIEFDLTNPIEKKFIITANGYVQYFEMVEDLVLMAPKLKGWRFIAFRPAVEEYPIQLDYEGLRLSSDNLWFLASEEPGEPHQLAVIVLFKDYDPAKEDIYFRAANKMLFFLLGEKSGILDVPYLQVDAMEDNPGELGILELEDLPSYIEMRKGQAVLN